MNIPTYKDHDFLKSASFSTAATERVSFTQFNLSNCETNMEMEQQPFEVTKAIRDLNLDSKDLKSEEDEV